MEIDKRQKRGKAGIKPKRKLSKLVKTWGEWKRERWPSQERETSRRRQPYMLITQSRLVARIAISTSELARQDRNTALNSGQYASYRHLTVSL